MANSISAAWLAPQQLHPTFPRAPAFANAITRARHGIRKPSRPPALARTPLLRTSRCTPDTCGYPNLASLHLSVHTSQLWIPRPGDSAPPASHGQRTWPLYLAFCEKGDTCRCTLASSGYPNLASLHLRVHSRHVWAPIPGDSAPLGAHSAPVGTRTWPLCTSRRTVSSRGRLRRPG